MSLLIVTQPDLYRLQCDHRETGEPSAQLYGWRWYCPLHARERAENVRVSSGS
jgi:hypothetical protein